jgi:uncharacterized protein (TIGR03437 family)
VPLKFSILAAIAATSLIASGPVYTADGVVNAASNLPGPIAPGMLVSIYGQGLSFITHALTPQDIHAGILPILFAGAGVSVSIGLPGRNTGYSGYLYYVSPTQINVLIPNSLPPGPADLSVGLNGLYGPAVHLTLAAAAPALFQVDGSYGIATQPDGTVLTKDAPAHPGDIIVIYATGLGLTDKNLPDGHPAETAFVLQRISTFRVRINGVQLDPAMVYYAGVTPGFAGLYQVNLKLPDNAGNDPEIRIGFDDAMSPEHILLHVAPAPPQL